MAHMSCYFLLLSCLLCDAIDQEGASWGKTLNNKDATCHLTAEKEGNDCAFETEWVCLGKMVSSQAVKDSLVL